MATDSSYTPHVEDEDSEIQSKKRAKELQEKIDRIEGHLEDKRKQLEFLKAMGTQISPFLLRGWLCHDTQWYLTVIFNG